MRYILIILSLLLLSSPLFGQSSKTLAVVLPPTIKGGISDTQIKFLSITLEDALSKYFAVSPPPQIESGECLAGCDYFQLQIAEEDGYPRLSLSWKSGNYSRIETKFCVGCNTTELNEKLKELVENLVGGKKGEKVLVVEKRRKGLLFLRLVNGEYRWFEDGDEDKDGKFDGEIENGLAHGLGTFVWSDGNKYEGEFKDGKRSGQGTLTSPDGSKFLGEFKGGKPNGQGTHTLPDGGKLEASSIHRTVGNKRENPSPVGFAIKNNDNVKKRMAKYEFVKVTKGLLPGSFEKNMPEKLAFVHMDLNSAETEMSLLNLFFDKLVPGGILILDDYGTMGYENQYSQEKEFFNERGYSVVELPTGGGLVIKR